MFRTSASIVAEGIVAAIALVIGWDACEAIGPRRAMLSGGDFVDSFNLSPSLLKIADLNASWFVDARLMFPCKLPWPSSILESAACHAITTSGDG